MRTWILDRYQVYARVVLMGAIFISPVIFHRNTQDVFNLLKFTVLLVATVAALALYMAWSAERAVWTPRFKLAWFAGAFLAACLLATVLSSSPTLSMIGLYHRYGGFLPFLLYAVLMWVIVGLYWEKPADLKEVARASVGASLLLTAYVLIQAAGLDGIDWKDSTGGPPPFPVGTMGNSNFAGAYLGIAVPFVAYVAATAKSQGRKAALFVFLGLDLLALWFTQTRGGMIAAGVGLLAMAFFYRDKLPRWLRIMSFGGTVAAVVLAVLILFHPGTSRPIGPLADVEAFRTGTFEVRTYYWGTALRIFKDNPIVGTGLDVYYANYPKYRLPQDGAQLGLTITDKPHNIFLEYLANAGILGAGAYLALVGTALWYGFRFSQRRGDPNRFLLVAFTSVLAGYLAQGVFSIDVPPLAVMGWLSLAGIAAIADPRVMAVREALAAFRQGRPGKPRKKKVVRGATTRVARHGGPRWQVHVSVALGSVIFLVVGIRPLLADIKIKDGLVLQGTKGAEVEAARYYRAAIKLNPGEAAYRSQAGSWQETLGNRATEQKQKEAYLTEALDYYTQALDRQPNNIFFLINIARVHTTWAEKLDPQRFPEAERWWRKAVAHDPTDWDVHNRYALMLNAYANSFKSDITLRRRTAERLEIVVGIKDDFLAGWINLTKVYRALGLTDKALDALEGARRLDPGDAEVKTLTAELGVTTSPTG